MFSEAKRNRNHGRSVRTASHRYTEWTPEESGPTEYELYDLNIDPKEFVNLAGSAEHDEVREQLAETLRAGWRAALPEGVSSGSAAE